MELVKGCSEGNRRSCAAKKEKKWVLDGMLESDSRQVQKCVVNTRKGNDTCNVGMLFGLNGYGKLIYAVRSPCKGPSLNPMWVAIITVATVFLFGMMIIMIIKCFVWYLNRKEKRQFDEDFQRAMASEDRWQTVDRKPRQEKREDMRLLANDSNL